MEEIALYKAMRSKLEARKKVSTAADYEGMLSNFKSRIADLVHNHFYSYPKEKPESNRGG